MYTDFGKWRLYKRIIIHFTLCFVLILTVAACSQGNEESTLKVESTDKTETDSKIAPLHMTSEERELYSLLYLGNVADDVPRWSIGIGLRSDTNVRIHMSFNCCRVSGR